MSEKPAPRKQRKKALQIEKTCPEGPPKRTYKFLSKQYTSLNLSTSSVVVAVARIRIMRKLGLSNTKFLRKVRLERYAGHENFWPVAIRNLVIVRGDLRVLEFDHFSWRDFYAKEDLRPIWNVILAKSKRLMILNANFLAEDVKQLRKLKRFRKLRDISIKAEGTKVSYKRLKKALNPRMSIQKLHINFSRCIEINDPEILAAAVSRIKGLKQISFLFELQENRESQIFNTSVLLSFIDFLSELDTPNLLRVQIAAKEILKFCIQSDNCAETATIFFDVIHKLVNKAGKKALTPALEALSEEYFEVLELEYLHRHVSANMIANEIKLLQKVNTLTMFHRKNEHLDIIDKSGEDPLEVHKLGLFLSEEVALTEDVFRKFTNVQELDLYIKYESYRHKALESFLQFAEDNFQVIRLKIVLSWELIMKENEFEDFTAMLAEIKKLKSLDLSIFGSHFGKRRLAALERLEKSTSLEEYTLTFRCYIKNIGNEHFLKYLKKARRLKAFRLFDYTSGPGRKYDKDIFYGILGRTRNLELINCE